MAQNNQYQSFESLDRFNMLIVFGFNQMVFVS
jgi:hypothetical protein